MSSSSLRILICRILALSVLGGLASFSAAEARGDPAANPATQPDPSDEKVWNLTDYLKGTAPQIRDRMNGELERLTTKKNELQVRASSYDAAILAEQAATLAQVRKSAAYVSLMAQEQQAEANLKTARISGTAEEKLDASSQFNKLRLTLEKIETDAVTGDPKIALLVKNKKEDQDELKRCDASAAMAQKWRDKLLSALRDTFTLHWPMEIGEVGTLGEVTPLETPAANSILVEYQAMEMLGEGKNDEGLTAIHNVAHVVRLRVIGIDTAGMRKGSPVMIDRSFAITKRPTRETRAFEVQRTPNELDRLFELVVPLRVAPATRPTTQREKSR